MVFPRDQPSRRATNASISGLRAGSSAAVSSRPGPHPTKRVSTVRHQHTSSASLSASRIGRVRAVSPAESLLSVATSVAGTKRKERDFEGPSITAGAAAASASDDGSVLVDVDHETNINVVVRCRGRNDREVRENSAVVVNTDGAKGKVVELMMGPNALSNKTYHFDRVFSPAADQSMLFDDVVKPILDEMLAGFNCTIFAYGQTGTGKTYTMSGDMRETLGLLTDAAGIIPRVLQSLFQTLERDESDSVVRCSFIELYNEELRDLLSADSDGDGKDGKGGASSSSGNKLKIFDDNSRKGHVTTVVQGMEERHIASAADGIKRLQEGSLRRQVAATKCNDLSSRSHTVFTITVHTKHKIEGGGGNGENNGNGGSGGNTEDFYTTGKLNLVDLAGSENIQRSGAENKRAAEAGLINKSLLTLGRVINALVDRTAHVPYRESKLTRLLQDSLGGRTKTCIIATISTAKSNLEETISTLDYAFRAKNIRNKPQVNQLVNKKTLLREFSAEIEKLKSDLIVTRQRNGVYLANEVYEEMTVQSESRRILAEEQAAKMETMENNLRNKLQELLSLTAGFMGLKKEHESAKAQLDATKGVLDETERVLAVTRKSLTEETRVREAHQTTETALAQIGTDLITTLQRTVNDIDGLRAKNRRKSELQGVNRHAWAGAQAQVADVTQLVEGRVQAMRAQQEQHLARMTERMQAFVQEEQQGLAMTQALMDTRLAAFEASQDGLAAQQAAAQDAQDAMLAELQTVREQLQARVGESLKTIAAAAERIAADVVQEMSTFHESLHASYSTLGNECKSVFEDLAKHMTAQQAEAHALRQQVDAAGQSAVQAQAAMAVQIEEAVEEERRLAAEDQKELLVQMGGLLAAHANAQAARQAAQARGLRARAEAARNTLAGELTMYDEGMDAWRARADEFADEMEQARDGLKKRLQGDWTAASAQSTAIQATAQTVHAATVGAVDEQTQVLAAQMQDLAQLATRTAERGAEQQQQHGTVLAALADAVTGGFAALSAEAQVAVQRSTEAAGATEQAAAALQNGWAAAESTVCAPLGDLRVYVGSTKLREYVATGETPEKRQYAYARELPRTAAHDELVAKLYENENTPSKSVAKDTKAPLVYDDRAPPSPSAGRARSSSNSTATTTATATTAPLLGMSLREVNPNVTAGPLLFEAGGTGTNGKDKDGGTEDLGCEESGDGVMESLPRPLFRRSTRRQSALAASTMTTMTTTSMARHNSRHVNGEPPQKMAKMSSLLRGVGGGGGSVVVPLEGRENVPPGVVMFSQSLSRRRSPRLN